MPGCRDATGIGGPAGVFVVAGGSVTDTVRAQLPDPLVVEVRDSHGGRLSGVVVRFRAVPGQSPDRAWAWQVLGLSTGSIYPSLETVFDTTDSQGRASVRIGFGNVATEGTVSINVPALAFDAQARFTVRPGNAVGVRALPEDSAVYVGGGYAVRGAAVDRWGNRRDDPVTYASSEGHISLTASGALTGTSIGRDFVVVARGEWRDTSWVSVVPHGRLAALKMYVSGGDTAAIVEFDLDGSGYRERTVPYWAQPRPDWTPDGALVHEDGGAFGEATNHLVVRDTPDAATRRLVSSETGLQQEFHGQVTADGAWVYFAGGFPDRQGHTELWRVRPDGTGAERVGEPAGYYEGDTQPSPSPDGSRVAYATDRHACCYGLTLRVLDVATGVIDSLYDGNGVPLAGSLPRWSPVADLIAYTAQAPNRQNVFATRIWLMRPDGSERRVVSDPDLAYNPAFDWSPDGVWIVARSFDADGLHLIQVATGLTLPLGYTRRLTQPAWQP